MERGFGGVVGEVGLCESDGDFVEGGAVDIGEEVPDVSVRIAVAGLLL